jgi:hypothetical protein
MEVLNGELRLIKAALEQLQGRFELLLGEVADFQPKDICAADLVACIERAASDQLHEEVASASPAAEDAEVDEIEAASASGWNSAIASVAEDSVSVAHAAVQEAPESQEQPDLEMSETAAAEAPEDAADETPIAVSVVCTTAAPVEAACASEAPSPAERTAPAEAIAASVEITPALPAAHPALTPLDAPCQARDPSNERPRQDRLSRYAAVAALVAMIVVMALVSSGVTRSFAGRLPGHAAGTQPS